MLGGCLVSPPIESPIRAEPVIRQAVAVGARWRPITERRRGRFARLCAAKMASKAKQPLFFELSRGGCRDWFGLARRVFSCRPLPPGLRAVPREHLDYSPLSFLRRPSVIIQHGGGEPLSLSLPLFLKPGKDAIRGLYVRIVAVGTLILENLSASVYAQLEC